MESILSFVGFVVIVSSMAYLVITYNYPTPLKDSLSEEQLRIKMESARVRRRAYYYGLAIAFVMYYVLKETKHLK